MEQVTTETEGYTLTLTKKQMDLLYPAVQANSMRGYAHGINPWKDIHETLYRAIAGIGPVRSL